MSKFLCCLFAFGSFFFNPFSSATNDYDTIYGENLTSRFILKTDDKVESVMDIPLRESWWSRPSEYAWAAKFAKEDAIVLDAACGVSHPFKWYLGENCKETWACDLDPRINKKETIIQETYDDLGGIAYEVLASNPQLIDQVRIINASITSLPESLPQFDRIFCISTLEHLTKAECKKALAEFERFLHPHGLVILTVDYPEITPSELIAMADSAGLVPAGNISNDIQADKQLTTGLLSIYRCVLKHKE